VAKSKKPSSGGKSAKQSPGSNAAKPDTVAADTKASEVTSKASQAAGAKAETKPVTESKPAASKPATATATSTATAKPTAPTSKPADVKPADAKPTTPAQAESTKPVSQAASKPVETKADAQTSKVGVKAVEKAPEPKATKSAESPKVVSKPADKTPPPAPAPQKPRGGFLPLVLGGLIAGGIGFAAAEYNWLNTRSDIDLSGIEQQLAAQAEQIAAIKPADLSGVESGITDLEAGVASLTETATTLDERLIDVEARPVAVLGNGDAPTQEYLEQLAEQYADQAAQAYAEELSGLRTTVDTQKDEIARLLENALSVEEATTQAAKAAAIQAAQAKLVVAMSSGAAYDGVIGELSEAGISDLPPELTDPAADGVATISTLQGDFPSVARAALRSARNAGVDAGTGGVGGFLQRQLGARSTAPREGSDPDAVLSRAEAAVRQGSVGNALTELETLPPEVQTAMEDWLAQARTRAAAEQAVQDLSERLTAN